MRLPMPDTVETKTARNPWRFSLRTLLIAITLAALAAALQSRFVASYERQLRIESELTAEYPDISLRYRQTMPDWLGEYSPKWTLEIFQVDVTGRRGRKNVSQYDFAYNDDDLANQIDRLAELPGLTEFHASETQLTTPSLDVIARIPSVTHINVYNTKMTPDGVREFEQENPHITVVYLNRAAPPYNNTLNRSAVLRAMRWII